MLRAGKNVRCTIDGRNLAGHAVRTPDAQEEPWDHCHRGAEPGAGDRRDHGDLQRRQWRAAAAAAVRRARPSRADCRDVDGARRSRGAPRAKSGVRVVFRILDRHAESSRPFERRARDRDRVRSRSVRRAGRPAAGRPDVSRRRSARRGAQRAAVAREVRAAIRMPSDSR